MLPNQTAAWALLDSLAAQAEPDIADLFKRDPERLARFSPRAHGILFDFSKLAIRQKEMAAMVALAEEVDLRAWQQKLFDGSILNVSEGRAATHMDLRAPQGRAGVAKIVEVAERIRSGAFGPIRHVLHIGIGGSALGPQLLVDALGKRGDGPRIHIIGNIDGASLDRVFDICKPHETLLIAVSKSFTTQETLVNMESAVAWLAQNGIENPMSRVVAVTAAPEKAYAAGIQDVLPFDESVGGRFSLWSAVGLPLAVRCGGEVFRELLNGAHAMDQHFLEKPYWENAPVMAALADVWASTFRKKQTRSVFAYDQRLRLLAPYLQQLEMESNGKSISRDGVPLGYHTAAITWGGTGTDAQHAVFQLLHQGPHVDPVEFVAIKEAGHQLDPIHHKLLLANCFAQGAALLRGRSHAEALELANGNVVRANSMYLPGNRGSSTILIDKLSPDRLGALLAFYEARTFTAGILLGINSFDQWGVELGKQIARQIELGETADFDISTNALMQAAGLI